MKTFKKISLSLLLASIASTSWAVGNEVESFSHQKRIEILKQAEACNQHAKTKAEYRQCEAQEKAARQALKKEVFAKQKQQIIQRLESRLNCIKAAQSRQDMKKCRPQKRH